MIWTEVEESSSVSCAINAEVHRIREASIQEGHHHSMGARAHVSEPGYPGFQASSEALAESLDITDLDDLSLK